MVRVGSEALPMILHNDARYYPIVCCVCKGSEFDHDRGAYGRCHALTPAQYERIAWRMAAGLKAAAR